MNSAPLRRVAPSRAPIIAAFVIGFVVGLVLFGVWGCSGGASGGGVGSTTRCDNLILPMHLGAAPNAFLVLLVALITGTIAMGIFVALRRRGARDELMPPRGVRSSHT